MKFFHSVFLFALASIATAGDCGITPYGAGAGGTNTGTLFSNSTGAPGSVLALQMNGFDAGPIFGPGVGALVLSTGDASIPLFGGTLLVDPSSTLVVHTVLYDIYAEAFFSVPTSPALAGVSIYAQTGLYFQASDVWGFSNGLRITICE